jgi:MoaA/NifB/PqqE/SkfB family radical SAM enzyme/predicted hotdog family 3-hydroxylacyl-ACP dehydratase
VPLNTRQATKEHDVRGDCSIRVSGIGFGREEIAACAARKGLLSIELDLSSGGECRCAACRAAPENSRAVLSSKEIGDLLRQARQEGARRCILVDSEPVSHPDLRGMIDAARGLGMEMELFASGAAIDGAMAAFLRQRAVAVVLKFNFERDNALKSALANLKESGYGRGTEPTLAVAISVSNETLPEIPAIWRWARSQGIEPYVQIITPRDVEAAKIVHPDRAKSLFEELGRLDLEEFGRTWEKPAALIGRSCNRHQFACHVTPCGTIFACVGVTIPLGNVRVEPLHEILELSEVLENLRAFGEKVKEPCRTCCKTTDCYGCRGSAYQLTGDYLAGDQMCWKAKGAAIETLPVRVVGLVPHGESMRMVDQLTKVGERNGQTTFLVRKECVMVDGSGRLDELAFIEMIAQSFAACHGFHLSLGERNRGLLLGVKELVVSGEARVGDRLTVHLRKVTRFGAFGVVEGDIYREDGKLVATGQVKIWRPSDDVVAAMSL